MRISDWSSDVCSSDLPDRGLVEQHQCRFVHDRGRDVQTPLHAARIRGNPVVLAIFQRHETQRCRNPFAPMRAAKAKGLCEKIQVFAPAQIFVQRQFLRRDTATLAHRRVARRSEEHTSELQSLMRISYAVFCLKKKKKTNTNT